MAALAQSVPGSPALPRLAQLPGIVSGHFGAMALPQHGRLMIVWKRAAMAALFMLSLAAAAQAGSDAVTSGLPVPRFVSLKTDRVNVRGGPEKDHDVALLYTR